MNAATSHAVPLLCQALVAADTDEEQRCLTLSRALEIIAVAVEDTDAYGALMDCASDIRAQAKQNIEARDAEDAFQWAQQRRA